MEDAKEFHSTIPKSNARHKPPECTLPSKVATTANRLVQYSIATDVLTAWMTLPAPTARALLKRVHVAPDRPSMLEAVLSVQHKWKIPWVNRMLPSFFLCQEETLSFSPHPRQGVKSYKRH